MARSLPTVTAFFRGLDDGAAQRRLEEEAAAKRKLEDQNFLFKTAAEQRAVEDQAQRGEVFNQGRTARDLAVRKAEFEAGQFIKNTPVLEGDADVARTKALFGQNLFKTNQPELEKNLADAAKTKIGQDALGVSQAGAQLKQMQDNPYVFNKALREGDAAIGAAGVESADSIITKRGLTLPPELAGAGEVTKLQWLENSGKFLNKTQAEMNATKVATEAAAAKQAAALALVDARNTGTATVATTNATSKEVIADKNIKAKYGDPAPAAAPAAPAAAAPAGAARVASPGLTAPSAVTAAVKAAVVAAPAPKAALPTPPVAQPAPELTPGEKAVDNAKVSYVQIQKEIEALQPPPSTSSRSRNGTPGQVTSAYLAWQASGKPALLQAKQAELQRMNAAFAQSLKR